MDKKTIAILIALTTLGIGLRLFWIFNVPTQQLFDFATFQEIASNIFHGRGHTLAGNPIAWVGPGYSYTLAFFHWIVRNDDPFNAMILNVILSSATLIMTGFIYRKWFPYDDMKLCVAYGITAVFPNLIAYNNVAGTETLFLFLLVVLILTRMYVPLGRKQAIVMGIICAFAALVKPFMLAYPAVAFAMWWMTGKNIKTTAMRTAIMFGVMLFVISPWTIRNYRTFGRFILISYNMGYNQVINNNYANIRGTWMPLEAVPMPDDLRAQVDYSLSGGRGIQEAHELEPLLSAHARHWMIRNPVAVGQLALMRVQQTFFNGAGDISLWAMNDWDFYDDQIRGSPIRSQRHVYFFQSVFDIVANVFAAAGLLFMILNLWRYVQDFFSVSYDNILTTAEGTVFINIAFFVTIVAAFEGQERYAHPVFIFFIFSLIWLARDVR